MNNATDFFQRSMLNIVSTNHLTINKPTGLCVALYHNNPSLSTRIEVSYTGYERQSISFSSSDDTDKHTGYIYNSNEIIFSNIPSTASGEITHIGVLDDAGNMWLFAEFAEKLDLSNLLSIVIKPNKLKFEFSGDFSDAYRKKFMNLFTLTSGNCVGISTPHIAVYTSSGELSTTNTGYSRKPVEFTLHPANISDGSTNYLSTRDGNGVDHPVSFPIAQSNWGKITSIAIVASNASNAEKYAELNLRENDVRINEGDSLRMDSITFFLTGGGNSSSGEENNPIFD